MATVAQALVEAGFPSPGIAVVEVIDVQDGRLRWTPWEIPAKNKNQHELQRFTLRFLDIANAKDDKEILDLAREFGPLGLCEGHGAPMCSTINGDDFTAPFARVNDPNLGIDPVCPPKLERGTVEGKPIYSEPVERWRHWARHARAILLLAEQIKRGELGEPEYWRDLTTPFPKGLTEATINVAGALELWRKLAELQPTTSIGPDKGAVFRLWLVSATAQAPHGLDGRLRPATGFRGALFGTVALHLLLAASAGAGIAHCQNSDCGRFYLPKKLPRTDRRNYCEVCQRSDAKRILSDRRRRPKRPKG